MDEEKKALAIRKRIFCEIKEEFENNATEGERATEAAASGELESKKRKLLTQNDDEDGLKQLEDAKQSRLLPEGLVKLDSSVRVKCDKKGCKTCAHVAEPFLHFATSRGKEHSKAGECHLCQLYEQDDFLCSLVAVEKARLKLQKEKK